MPFKELNCANIGSYVLLTCFQKQWRAGFAPAASLLGGDGDGDGLAAVQVSEEAACSIGGTDVGVLIHDGW